MDLPADDVVESAEADVEDVGRILSRAFADDPVISWMFDDDERQRDRIGQAFEIWTRRIFLPSGRVVTDRFRRAAACWASPGRWQLDMTRQLALLPSMLRLFGARRLPAVLSGMGRMSDAHPDDRPHWYLGFIGTDPAHQGQGVGTRLLDHALARCDQDRTPVYLEASRPANVPFYERFGFRVREEFEMPAGPPVWGMWREPA